jgi:hypothetical protein
MTSLSDSPSHVPVVLVANTCEERAGNSLSISSESFDDDGMVNPPPPTILHAAACDFLVQLNGGSSHPKLATSTETKRSGVLNFFESLLFDSRPCRFGGHALFPTKLC